MYMYMYVYVYVYIYIYVGVHAYKVTSVSSSFSRNSTWDELAGKSLPMFSSYTRSIIFSVSKKNSMSFLCTWASKSSQSECLCFQRFSAIQSSALSATLLFQVGFGLPQVPAENVVVGCRRWIETCQGHPGTSESQEWSLRWSESPWGSC